MLKQNHVVSRNRSTIGENKELEPRSPSRAGLVPVTETELPW